MINSTLRDSEIEFSQNRFQSSTNVDDLMGCFNSLTELGLNNTLISWHDITKVTATMPKLRTLEVGYNRFTDDSLKSSHPLWRNTSVRAINLDTNQISEWEDICTALLELPLYRTVY